MQPLLAAALTTRAAAAASYCFPTTACRKEQPPSCMQMHCAAPNYSRSQPTQLVVVVDCQRRRRGRHCHRHRHLPRTGATAVKEHKVAARARKHDARFASRTRLGPPASTRCEVETQGRDATRSSTAARSLKRHCPFKRHCRRMPPRTHDRSWAQARWRMALRSAQRRRRRGCRLRRRAPLGLRRSSSSAQPCRAVADSVCGV